MPAPAGAAPPPIAPSWVANGDVYAIARVGDAVYLGGDFSRVGPPTGPLVALSRETGERDARFPEASGRGIHAVEGDGRGGWYVGGDFRSLGGVACRNLARVRRDGTIDPAWCPRPNGPIWTLAPHGRTVYAGGFFDRIGGKRRESIAAVAARSGRVRAWNARVQGGGVWALAVRGRTVYAGGLFDEVGGKKRRGLAALSGRTGRLTPWNPRLRGSVREAHDGVADLVVAGRRLYVTGGFARVGDVKRRRLAAFDLRTGKVTRWNPRPNGPVAALAAAGGRLVVGGWFTRIRGAARPGLAVFAARSGRLSAVRPTVPSSGAVLALGVARQTVYAAGPARWRGMVSPPYELTAFDVRTGRRAGPALPDANHDVSVLAASGRTVIVGGEFSSVGGVKRANVAALDAATGEPTTWNPGANGKVTAFAVDGSTLYVGGGFSRFGGEVRRRLAAVETRSGAVTPWSPDVRGATPERISWDLRGDPGVAALAVAGTTVFAGGNFGSVGGVRRRNLAAIDAATGAPTSWAPAANGVVRALVEAGGTVYVGGEFSRVAGQPRRRLAALDAATGAVRAWDPSPREYRDAANDPADVTSLAASGNTVYVGGSFSRIGGRERRSLAAVDVSSGAATAWRPPRPTAPGCTAAAPSTCRSGSRASSPSTSRRQRTAGAAYRRRRRVSHSRSDGRKSLVRGQTP